MYDGSAVASRRPATPTSLSHAIGGGRYVRAPVADASLAPARGPWPALCRGDQRRLSVRSSCARDAGSSRPRRTGRDYEWPPTPLLGEMAWTQAGKTAGLLLAQPLDLTGRAARAADHRRPAHRPPPCEVRVTDADGATATGARSEAAACRRSERTTTASCGRRPSSSTRAAAPVDLAHIVRVDLVSGTAHGRLWVADLAAAPATLAAVPAHRLPTIDLDNRRVTEGSGGAKVVKDFPFHVRGTLRRRPGSWSSRLGQRPGDVRRRYRRPGARADRRHDRHPVSSDRRPDYRRLVTQVGAWATSNVMTDDYTGVGQRSSTTTRRRGSSCGPWRGPSRRGSPRAGGWS